MIINSENCQVGNKAMAQVLLLYYHLTTEGGFSHAETVYIDPEDFNGLDFLDAKVKDEEGYSLDIDESLIREGAIIYLLCDLNDMISEFEDDYLNQPITKKIIEAYKQGKLSAVPETQKLFSIIEAQEDNMDYKAYNKCLSKIYETYVIGRFKAIIQ